MIPKKLSFLLFSSITSFAEIATYDEFIIAEITFYKLK